MRDGKLSHDMHFYEDFYTFMYLTIDIIVPRIDKNKTTTVYEDTILRTIRIICQSNDWHFLSFVDVERRRKSA